MSAGPQNRDLPDKACKLHSVCLTIIVLASDELDGTIVHIIQQCFVNLRSDGQGLIAYYQHVHA